MTPQSSDMQSGASVQDLPQNVGSNARADTAVSHARHAQPVLDAAGRARNGRQSHGLNIVKRAVRELNRSRKVLDRRTGAGKWLHERRETLVEALGGADVLSPQLDAIVDSTVRTELMLGHVDAYLLELGPQIVNRRRRTLIPVVQQRTALANSLLAHLEKLGLERRQQPAEDLHSYMKRRAAESAGGASVP